MGSDLPVKSSTPSIAEAYQTITLPSIRWVALVSYSLITPKQIFDAVGSFYERPEVLQQFGTAPLTSFWRFRTRLDF